MSHSVFCFFPAFGQMLSASTFLTSHALANAFQSKSIGYGVSTLSFPDIAELRSMAFTIWHDTMPNMSHLLFIDSDMGFNPDVVLDMLLLDEPLVGAIYAQRRLPQSWAGSGTGNANVPRRGNFMVVEGVGMGCTLIRRDLATKMIAEMPQLIDTRINLHPANEMMRAAGANRLIRAFEKLDLKDRGIVSEDLSFCIRWRQLGGEVWASIGHRFSHVGPYDYSGRYLDAIDQKTAEEHAKGIALLSAPPAAPVLPPPQFVLPPPQLDNVPVLTNGHDPAQFAPVPLPAFVLPESPPLAPEPGMLELPSSGASIAAGSFVLPSAEVAKLGNGGGHKTKRTRSKRRPPSQRSRGRLRASMRVVGSFE